MVGFPMLKVVAVSVVLLTKLQRGALAVAAVHPPPPTATSLYTSGSSSIEALPEATETTQSGAVQSSSNGAWSITQAATAPSESLNVDDCSSSSSFNVTLTQTITETVMMRVSSMTADDLATSLSSSVSALDLASSPVSSYASPSTPTSAQFSLLSTLPTASESYALPSFSSIPSTASEGAGVLSSITPNVASTIRIVLTRTRSHTQTISVILDNGSSTSLSTLVDGAWTSEAATPSSWPATTSVFYSSSSFPATTTTPTSLLSNATSTSSKTICFDSANHTWKPCSSGVSPNRTSDGSIHYPSETVFDGASVKNRVNGAAMAGLVALIVLMANM